MRKPFAFLLALFALFLVTKSAYAQTPCDYTPGDLNGIGGANGIDVVYAVTYLKGGNPPVDDCNPPCTAGVSDPFYAAMDVNGDCRANGIDIVWYIYHVLWEETPPHFCPGCPPLSGGLRHIDIRGDCLGAALDDSSYMYVEVIGDDLHIHHMDAIYQCCLEYSVEYRMAGQDITAVEHDTGPPCDCICPFNLESILYDLTAGQYFVTLIGVFGDTVGVDTAYVGGF